MYGEYDAIEWLDVHEWLCDYDEMEVGNETRSRSFPSVDDSN